MMDAKALLAKVEKKEPTSNSLEKNDPSFARTFESISKNWHISNCNDQEISAKKLEKNLSKSEVKLEKKLEKNLSKSEVKLEKNLSKKKGNLSKSEVKLEYKLENELEKNLSKSEVKLEKNLHFLSAVGQQKRVLVVIFFAAYNSGSRTTPPLTIRFIAEASKSPFSSMRKCIQILEKKKFLKRIKFKNGRGGWTQYQVPDRIYQQMLQLKSEVKLEKNLSKSEVELEYKLEYKLEKNLPSSSSNITTTTGADKNSLLSAIVVPQEVRKIGFGKSHLHQIEKMGGFTAEDINESLEHFAYDLEKGNLRIRTNAAGFLMGIFRKGDKYTSSHYVEQLEADIAGHLAELENRRKEREGQKARMEQLLFEEWAEKKSDEELQNIMASPTGVARGQMHMQMLKAHFVEKEMDGFKKVFFAKETGRVKGEETASCPN